MTGFYFRRIAGAFLQILAPSYGTCYRCRWPWKFTDHHITWYGDKKTRGCFPLCELCWSQLEIPNRRLKYYERLINHWKEQGGWPVEEQDIIMAVLKGG